MKNEQPIVKLLREISADLQTKCEDNEFLRAEIEEYFEKKIDEVEQ